MGLNNNPTVVQFKAALRKLILGACHLGEFENTIAQDDTFLPVPPSTLQNYKVFTEQYNLDDEDIDVYTLSLDRTCEFKSLALNYIAGYVQWKVLQKEQCDGCKSFLANLKICNADALILKKNRGGLTVPSVEVDRLVKLSEDVFVELMSRGEKCLAERYLIEKISVKICSQVHDLFPSLFRDLSDHHQNLLIKKIVQCFITLRLKHYMREMKTDVCVRRSLSKLILYKGQ